MEHLVLRCTYTAEVRRIVYDDLKLTCRSRTREEWRGWYSRVTAGTTARRRCMLAAMMYEIWRERNARVFLQDSLAPEIVFVKVKALAGSIL